MTKNKNLAKAVRAYTSHGTAEEWEAVLRALDRLRGHALRGDLIALVWAVQNYEQHGTHEAWEDLILSLDAYGDTNYAGALLRSPIHGGGRAGRAAWLEVHYGEVADSREGTVDGAKVTRSVYSVRNRRKKEKVVVREQVETPSRESRMATIAAAGQLHGNVQVSAIHGQHLLGQIVTHALSDPHAAMGDLRELRVELDKIEKRLWKINAL